jgi:hypothetical protein
MTSCGAMFPNCARTCQTQATMGRRVTILVESSGRLQSVPRSRMHCSTDHRTHAFTPVLYDTAFFTCEPITCLPATARALCQSQLRFFSYIGYVIFSPKSSLRSACWCLVFCKRLVGAARFEVSAVYPHPHNLG